MIALNLRRKDETMNKKMTKVIVMILAFVMSASMLTGCGKKVDTNMEVRFSVLSGTTGWGAVKILSDAEKGEAGLNYVTSIESSPKVIQDALVAGEIDLAALPTNKAAMIAKATDGAVEVVAVNTLGVMYMVCSSELEIASFGDLAGVTICIPEEPSYILKALLEANGMEEAIIETYGTPADLLALVAAGEVDCAVLPEPLLTAACAKNQDMKIVMNLTEEWDKVFDAPLMQGCIVVRTDWAKEHSAELSAFLDEYKASVEFVTGNIEESSALIETYFGTGAPAAGKAIPRCNLTFLAGSEMKASLQKFYEVLVTIESSNIGGVVPADDFYYVGK